MTIKNACSAVMLGLAAAVFALVWANPSAAALEKMPGKPLTLLAGPRGPVTFIRPPAPTVAQPEAATITVAYTGFPAAAKTAFQRAVNIWKGLLTSSAPIKISASFTPLGTGVLGQAGPHFFWRFSSGATPDTWYPDALANKIYGSDIDPSVDIIAQFISGGKGTVRAAGFPFIYDRYTENNAGKAMLSFPDNSAALATQLQGGNLYFDSTQVRAANRNLRARLYAPAVFQPGSTYSHLNEATYPAGNANSLMTPQLGQGETIRSPGAITLAIFRTLGW